MYTTCQGFLPFALTGCNYFWFSHQELYILSKSHTSKPLEVQRQKSSLTSFICLNVTVNTFHGIKWQKHSFTAVSVATHDRKLEGGGKRYGCPGQQSPNDSKMCTKTHILVKIFNIMWSTIFKLFSSIKGNPINCLQFD